MTESELRQLYSSIDTREPSAEFVASTRRALDLEWAAQSDEAGQAEPDGPPGDASGRPALRALDGGSSPRRRAAHWAWLGVAAATVAVVVGASLLTSNTGSGPTEVEVVGPADPGDRTQLELRVEATVPVDVPAAVAVGPHGAWVPSTGQIVRIDLETNAVVAAPEVDGQPYGVVATDDAVWFSDNVNDTVSRIDPATNRIVATIPVGERPNWVTFGAGAIWVSNRDSDTVSRIDPATNAVTATIPVASTPTIVMEGGGGVWVSTTGANSVSRIDPATNTVSATVALDASPSGMATGGGAVWVTAPTENKVHRIDPDTNAVVASIDIDSPVGIEADDDNVFVMSNWLCEQVCTMQLERIDPDTNAVTTRLELEEGVIIGGVGIGDDAVWLSNIAGQVLRVTYAETPSATAVRGDE